MKPNGNGNGNGSSSNRAAPKRTFSSEDSENFTLGVTRSRSKLGMRQRPTRSLSNDSLGNHGNGLNGNSANGENGTLRNPRSGTRKAKLRNSSAKKWYQQPKVRVAIAILCAAYLAVMAHFLSFAADNAVADDGSDEAAPVLLGPLSIDRHVHDEQRSADQTQFRLERADRNAGRRYRTTPDAHGAQHVQLHAFETAEHWTRDDHPKAIVPDKLPPDLKRPATPDELCGVLAQTRAVEMPDNYLHKDALNEHARVIINGILNPLGFHLALALEQRCGAHVISGFDPAFPNTVTNRMSVQEEAGILTSTVTTLERPIFNSFLGLDPKVKNPAWPAIAVTGELDISKWQPTHVINLASFAPELFRNRGHNDAQGTNNANGIAGTGHAGGNDRTHWRNEQSPYVREDYDPRLYGLRSSLVPQEQLLASLSLVGNKPRLPHYTYASSNQVHQTYDNDKHTFSDADAWQAKTSLMDEVLADTYYQTHGTYSVGLRLPNAIVGPRGHVESDVRRMMENEITPVVEQHQTDSEGNPVNAERNITWTSQTYDLVHMDDIIDGIIAAMQFRNTGGKPVALEFSSGKLVDREELQDAVASIRKGEQPKIITHRRKAPPKMEGAAEETITAAEWTQKALGWKPQVSPEHALVRTMAWHLDRQQPYGPPPANRPDPQVPPKPSGDDLLEKFGVPFCKPDDNVCHSSRHALPCASECQAHPKQCAASLWDSAQVITQELSQDCTIVLYTQSLGDDVEDIALQAEAANNATDPVICNFALVSGQSKLVNSVIHKVPDEELTKLGVQQKDDPEQRKKLNGRLLYRGWIMVWVDEPTPDPIPTADLFLLKLSPGKFFDTSVQYAMYVDQSFPAMPTVEDVKFLAHQMIRPSWDQRTVKRKTRPKAKFRLPPEPARQAGLLLAQLKYQDSKSSEVLPSDTHVTLNSAVKFMRFEKGQDTQEMPEEPDEIRIYREFLERIPTYVNRGDYMKSSSEPVFFYELHHWVRTQWVMHDLTLEPARNLRCDWYQETVQWDTPLDQLSLAHVLKRREMHRRIVNHELDDIQMRYYDEKRDMLGLLSDAEEWHPLDTPQNKLCPTNYELEVMPYDKADTGAEESTQTLAPGLDDYDQPPLYARIISDRIMALSRKAWNKQKKAELDAAKKAHAKQQHQHDHHDEKPKE